MEGFVGFVRAAEPEGRDGAAEREPRARRVALGRRVEEARGVLVARLLQGQEAHLQVDARVLRVAAERLFVALQRFRRAPEAVQPLMKPAP